MLGDKLSRDMSPGRLSATSPVLAEAATLLTFSTFQSAVCKSFACVRVLIGASEQQKCALESWGLLQPHRDYSHSLPVVFFFVCFLKKGVTGSHAAGQNEVDTRSIFSICRSNAQSILQRVAQEGMVVPPGRGVALQF